MTDHPFAAIQGEVKPEDLYAQAAGAGIPFSTQGCQRIYYPYDWYVFRYRARTWLGATTTLISCLVDARTRVCATADPFRLENRTPGDDWILDRREDRNTTLALARRYAGHAVRQKHKALVLPRVDVVESRPVYKPFWVTDCNLKSGATQTMLIDGVTGDYCALRPQAGASPCRPVTWRAPPGYRPDQSRGGAAASAAAVRRAASRERR